MSKCPCCGGELAYSAGESKVVCPYCKTSFNPSELNTKTKFSKEQKTFEGKSYHCSQCGATLLTFDETAITFCSYCGSQSVIESKMVKVNSPDFVIPFSITREECIKLYKKYVNNSLFAPNYMKENVAIEKFRGIYMPYSIYKASFHGINNNKGEKYSGSRGNYSYYDIFTIKAQVDAEYTGISYDLLSKFYDDYSMSIPFDYKGVMPFNKNYLMGFYADMKDVDETLYDQRVIDITSKDASKHLSERKEYMKYGCLKPTLRTSIEERKTGMFPVYFLAIKDKSNKIHYAIINGQNGKMAIDLPIDFKKFILGTLLLSILIFGILYFGDVILPKTVLIFSLMMSILSIAISTNQLNKIHEKEHHLKDRGYIYSDSRRLDTETKSKKKIKFKDIAKQVFAIIISVVILCINTINDEIYYGGSIAVFVLIVLSFKDLIKEHNILTSNKPPQLEKRGGEEYGK